MVEFLTLPLYWLVLYNYAAMSEFNFRSHFSFSLFVCIYMDITNPSQRRGNISYIYIPSFWANNEAKCENREFA